MIVTRRVRELSRGKELQPIRFRAWRPRQGRKREREGKGEGRKGKGKERKREGIG